MVYIHFCRNISVWYCFRMKFNYYGILILLSLWVWFLSGDYMRRPVRKLAKRHFEKTRKTHLKCVFIFTLGVVQQYTYYRICRPPFVDIECLHFTNMAENIMFLHNIMFWALVALGEFSHRTPHMQCCSSVTNRLILHLAT